MPQQRAAEPAAERDAVREAEGEQRRGVIGLPAGHDHQDHRDRVGPVHDPDPGRLDDFRRLAGEMTVGCCKAGHGCSVADARTTIIRPKYSIRYYRFWRWNGCFTGIGFTKKRAGFPRLACVSWW